MNTEESIKSKLAVTARSEKLATKLTKSNAQTYADTVNAHLAQPQERPNTSKTKHEKVFPLKGNEMTINQQLQLILEKLDKQEKKGKSMLSRLDRLENDTFKGATRKGINGQ
jgi:hypothetical protein